MNSLDQLQVTVERESAPEMVRSILSEISTLLEQWIEQGIPGVLDLKGLPLTTADHQQLEAALGQGEVSISLNVMGESQIVETGFDGVWYVIHRDELNQTLAKQIEVVDIPSIVRPQLVDIERSSKRMKVLLSNN